MWLGMDFIGLILFWDLLNPLNVYVYNFHQIWEVFSDDSNFFFCTVFFFAGCLMKQSMPDFLVLSHRFLKLWLLFYSTFSLLFSLDKLLLISKFMDSLLSPFCYCTCPMSFLLLYFSVQIFYLVFLFLFLYWDNLPFHSFQESSPLPAVVYL